MARPRRPCGCMPRRCSAIAGTKRAQARAQPVVGLGRLRGTKGPSTSAGRSRGGGRIPHGPVTHVVMGSSHACMHGRSTRQASDTEALARPLFAAFGEAEGGKACAARIVDHPRGPVLRPDSFFFGGHVGHSARLAATLVRWCGSRRTVAFSSAQAQQS